ncbi:MAG: hypothetical protein QNK82_12900 [Akkermansiaceae bacterium]|jgi:hypothetical protein|nr:hypothetical protein [Akkermansiaceae bacterium]|tara:strand:+ start:2955 stop:3176 length:222 start_codon:yes stop_codon:yes gene_type:complete
MKHFSVFLTMVGLFLCSCERHEWHTDPDKKPKSSDTINLFLHEEHPKEGEDKKGEEHVKPEGEKKEAEAPEGE